MKPLIRLSGCFLTLFLFCALVTSNEVRPEEPKPVTIDFDKVASESVLSIISYDKDHRKLGYGSGFITHGKNKETYIFTAAHVVADLRSEMNKFSGHIEAVRVIRNDEDEVIGQSSYKCKLLRYSHHPSYFNRETEPVGEDLAILQIDASGLGTPLQINKDKKKPKVGSHLWVLGTMLSPEDGINLAFGTFGSKHIDYLSHSFYQITSTSPPGTSGGPVIRSDGKVIGMLTRGRDTMLLLVPDWRILKWVEKVDALWAVDKDVERTKDNSKVIEFDY